MNNYLEKMIAEGMPYDQITPIDTSSYKELVERIKAEPEETIIKSNLPELDALFGGFENGRLYVLSAPTKNGKTLMAQTIMYNMAQKGNGSIFFSYEMGWREIVKKFMEMDGELQKNNTPTDLPLFMPIELHRGGGELQYQWLFDAIAKAKLERNIKLAVIDHLHFLLPLKDFKNTSFIIGGIVREIKRMAVVLDIPIILICHIGMLKDDKVPDWTMIRDSSFITQEADVVFMLYRIKSKEAARKTTQDNSLEIYTRKSILSLELDRKKGRSGKIKLWHNGICFEIYNGQDGEYIDAEKFNEPTF